MGITASQEFEPIPFKDIQNGTIQSQKMCQQMVENGFCVLSFEEDQCGTIDNMYTVGNDFLVQDKDLKNKHADPKNENVGYVDVEGTRDFIKLRAAGDRLGNFPETPPNFKQVFSAAYELLAGVTWQVYLQILACPVSQSDPKAFPSEVISSLKECLDERASLSYIRYYLPPPSPNSPPSSLRDVCDAHTDTGILTLILCSQVPGLQVWDKKTNTWLEVEKHLITHNKTKNPKKHLALCIMGEKIGTFTSSRALTPTLHRVMVENGIERSSLLYFMDTAK
eukprot:Phypoly_transcript_15420.p1 GENE.Phypoly_transcript_15420~~Phypoly_transcript_15420.p1  ORF type:complete len:280 (+),score=60.65 Phypoly_transcript_15420:40-879(+)